MAGDGECNTWHTVQEKQQEEQLKEEKVCTSIWYKQQDTACSCRVCISTLQGGKLTGGQKVHLYKNAQRPDNVNQNLMPSIWVDSVNPYTAD